MRAAIVHDYLTQRGGAERVVLSLLRLFPNADLYTSVYDPEGTYPEFREYDVRTTWLQRWLRPGSDARKLLPLYPRAFESLRIDGYDLVISSSSGFAHGVNVGGATHVCYCYNPPRWLYQREDYLAEGSAAPRWARPALTPLLASMRRWDQRAAARPDRYVTISRAVAQRVAETYRRESYIVPPPVDVGRIVEGPREVGSRDPFVLVVSRLLPYKRVDLAIDACRRAELPLVIVGEGPSETALRSKAGPGVEWVGRVSEPALNGLLHDCIAVVQAGTEDFGLGPLEANAAGKPALAFAAAGALETVMDGTTGVLVGEQTVDAFVDGLDRIVSSSWSPELLRNHALSFGEERFHHGLRSVLDGALSAPLVAVA